MQKKTAARRRKKRKQRRKRISQNVSCAQVPASATHRLDFGCCLFFRVSVPFRGYSCLLLHVPLVAGRRLRNGSEAKDGGPGPVTGWRAISVRYWLRSAITFTLPLKTEVPAG